MINQKMIFATVVGFVVMFGLAGLFHLVIMKDYFDAHAGVASSMMYPLLSYPVLAILMSYIYPMMNIGGTAIKAGLCFGVLMGLVCRVPLEILQVGFGKGDWGFVIIEGIWHSVEEGIGGIAIAMMYARAANS